MDVDFLELDVVVLDAKERPVGGLTKDDFEVRIARALQPIESFEAPPAAALPGSTVPAPEALAGGTVPIGTPARGIHHVLFFLDLEQLPAAAVPQSADAIRKAIAGVPRPVRFSLATHFGRSSPLAWDEDVADRVTTPLETLDVASVLGDPVSTTGGVEGGTGQYVENPRSYDLRQSLETRLVRNLLNMRASGNSSGIADAWRQINEYVRGEDQRVRDLVEGLRSVSAEFAALDGKRTLVYVSRGFERAPGQNFLARVEVAVKSQAQARAAGGRPPTHVETAPSFAGQSSSSTGGIAAFRLPQVDDFERWLAASGVTLHVLDPAPGAILPGADTNEPYRDLRNEQTNLQDAPVRFAYATGGLVRPGTGNLDGALQTFLAASSGAYRIAVRMTDVDPRRAYKVEVIVKKPGLKAHARSAYQPKAPADQRTGLAGADSRAADRGRLRAAGDERRPGAGRLVLKPIAVTLTWKGKSATTTTASGQVFYKLDVGIPHDDLKFLAEDDAMVASARIAVKAESADGKGSETFTDDLFLSMTGAEYSAAAGQNAVRTLTLPLTPGRWDLTVTVTDLIESHAGVTRLRVTAEP